MPPVQKQPELSGTDKFLAPDAPPYSSYLVKLIARSEGSVDFASLRTELYTFVTEIELIKIPSREEWERLQVQKFLGRLWCKRWRSSQLEAWKSPSITQRAPHSKSQERFCV
jgi:hypothetical protein